MTINANESLQAAVSAIHTGDVAALTKLLIDHDGLATARLDDDVSRSLLHVATDWPGHRPHGVAVVTALVEAGADVNARVRGRHRETPLHWAASNDDVDVLDALLDRGAEINWMPGWEPLTPLDAARRSQADELVAWLRSHGAHSASELTG